MGEIVVGKFVDRDRPDYQTMMRAQYVETLGDRYIQRTRNGVRMRLTEGFALQALAARE